ncbi:MAG: 2-oxo acid dehydrogenase subunit E2 [Kiritimatiellales bacterium]|nr:2-oxo acid dehydrogenase subunit E2 [Kiritimatiellales bacterium]
MATEFRLPELGENIESGDVINVLVKVGDAVKLEQSVLEVEAGKATMEIPSTVEGTVTVLHVKAGDGVEVGQVILEVGEGAAAAPVPVDAPAEEAPQPAEASAEAASQPEEVAPEPVAEPEPQPRAEEPDGEPVPSPVAEAAPVEKPAAPAKAAVSAAPVPEGVVPEPVAEPEPQPKAEEPEGKPAPAPVAEEPPSEKPTAPAKAAVSAAPNVRRLAREIGVDIHNVKPANVGGRISAEEVKAYAKRLILAGSQLATASGGRLRPSVEHARPLPDFGSFGNIRREKMSQVRKATMEHLTHAWVTIPHVTQHDMADITKLEELRKRFAPKAEAAGTKLTVTAILVKVVAAALKVHPKFNSSIDPTTEEILYKDFYNIGVAVDTEKGLLVPVIRDADKKNMVALAQDLGAIAQKARGGKIALADLQGGTFTITNLGGIGGSFFTPIVNSPEVAILGVGRAIMDPCIGKGDGMCAPRLRMPLSLSYDHRIIDGADGARFLRWVVEAIEEPMLISLEG